MKEIRLLTSAHERYLNIYSGHQEEERRQALEDMTSRTENMDTSRILKS